MLAHCAHLNTTTIDRTSAVPSKTTMNQGRTVSGEKERCPNDAL